MLSGGTSDKSLAATLRQAVPWMKICGIFGAESGDGEVVVGSEFVSDATQV